ncbi:MAG: hypothetical protein BWY72_00468 [Bacteroidetes bacterium ADurb.Bin416]|nr:MAG: hypothetical protein BWY72_00468 [Bacteroidetes bacterium ADurb.Bin416]
MNVEYGHKDGKLEALFLEQTVFKHPLNDHHFAVGRSQDVPGGRLTDPFWASEKIGDKQEQKDRNRQGDDKSKVPPKYPYQPIKGQQTDKQPEQQFAAFLVYGHAQGSNHRLRQIGAKVRLIQQTTKSLHTSSFVDNFLAGALADSRFGRIFKSRFRFFLTD